MFKSTKIDTQELKKLFARFGERFRPFSQKDSEPDFCIELEHPIDMNLSEDEQLDNLYMYAYIAKASDKWARTGGFESASDLVGARLDEILPHYEPKNIDSIKKLIRSNYMIQDGGSSACFKQGQRSDFIKTIVGTVENGRLINLRGSAGSSLHKNN